MIVFNSFSKKMFQKFEVCDCFLDVACYCLEKNADVDQF